LVAAHGFYAKERSMEFPKTLLGRVAWLSSACAAIAACALFGLTVKEAAPILLGVPVATSPGAPSIERGSARGVAKTPGSTKLAEAVRLANEAAGIELDQRMAQCKSYLQTWVGRDGIGEFVEEMTSFTQKFYQVVNSLGGQSGEKRLQEAFRDFVLDDAELSRFVDATVDGYEAFLDEQDREILRTAGIMETDILVDLARPTLPNCRRMVDPIIRMASGAARDDIGRAGFAWVSGAVAGYAANRAARATGLNDFEEGSWSDLAAQTGISLGAEEAIDQMTDPTERLIAIFTREVAMMGYTLFFGDQGLGSTLNYLKEEHERARVQLLTTGAGR
jgi:hypothetical protein